MNFFLKSTQLPHHSTEKAAGSIGENGTLDGILPDPTVLSSQGPSVRQQPPGQEAFATRTVGQADGLQPTELLLQVGFQVQAARPRRWGGLNKAQRGGGYNKAIQNK